MKVLVLAIGHPEYELGGADRAAYSLFQGIKSRAGHSAHFAAPVSAENIGHDGLLGCYAGKSDEIIFVPPAVNYLRLVSMDYGNLRRIMDDVLDVSQPDIVHVTHFLHCGLDVLQIVKEHYGLPLAVTFNEYTSICHHYGQMITTDRRLCYESGADACHACFPHIPAGHFFARHHLVRDYLNLADLFIAPSPFLRKRFAQYGLPDEKFVDIGYVQGNFDQAGSLSNRCRSKKVRLGFFGRINPFKGVDLLLEAILRLPETLRDQLELIVFGANLESESDEFQSRIRSLLDRAGPLVTLFGSYSHDQTLHLMGSVDWVVVPSIWWEVGPIVIEEAFAAGTPVIASDIAGMEEKVAHGDTGLLFTAGSVVSLSETIASILTEGPRKRLSPTSVPQINRERVSAHLSAYESVLNAADRRC